MFYSHLKDVKLSNNAGCLHGKVCGFLLCDSLSYCSAPSDRPQGNLCLKPLIALKMCSPHLAEKNKSFKGTDSLLQLTLTLCRSQAVKKTVFSEFPVNRILVYSKVLL